MTNCQGCTSSVPEGSRYCPRCGLAAGAVVPELSAWQAEEQTKRPPPTRSRPWGSDEPAMGEAELLGGEQPQRSSRRRRYAIALVAAIAIVVGVVVGVDHAGSGGHKGPTSSLAGSVPLQVSPTRTKPKAPRTLPASLGDEAIGLAPAVKDDPRLNDAIDLLSRYFAAINSHHDYTGWRDTLLPTPNRGTVAAYQGYRTSHDSAILINDISDNRDGSLRVSVSFTSQQAPHYGEGFHCLIWSIDYSLVRYHGQYRIDLVGTQHINKVSC